MRQRVKGLLAVTLSLIMALQIFPPITGFAESAFENTGSGSHLFEGEGGDRLFVSETAYQLAPGVTEYVTYTNEESGLNQNIDYFCEIDLSQAQIIAGYAGLENILSDNEITWRMQTVSDQVKSAQSFFNRTDLENYAGATVVAAINADYYNMATGQPSGILIIDGVTYNDTAGKYYFAIDKDGQALISDSYAEEDLANLQHAVAGGSLLVKDGEVNVEKGGRNVTYTAVGIKADGTVVTMVCYGQRYPVSCGYTQYEVAQMMKERGCETALLLDGSGSSTFVSRRDGDGSVITRNNPSDGQERQVSSSLMVLSKASSDGIFDHAAISPNNEVYTPGSKVQFTATGADQSGAPAPLPEGLSWVVESKFGKINSNTGEFTSNGTIGDVSVSLYDETGNVVGTTQITIAEPDKIQFSAEKASIGEGETSDLGLQVTYKQREVHYKDGDFEWTIAPTQYNRRQWTGTGSDYEIITETEEKSPQQMPLLSVGTVKDNKLTCQPVYSGENTNENVPEDYALSALEKTATDIEAVVTVTSAFDSQVSGSVVLEACKEPQTAMDFEQESAKIFHGKTAGGADDYCGQFLEDGSYEKFETVKNGAQIAAEGYDIACLSYTDRTTPEGSQVGTARIVSADEGYPVRFGNQSLRVDYDFNTNMGKTDGVCFGLSEEIKLEAVGNPTRIGIWVYIPKDTPNLWLRLRYRDGLGNTSQVDFTENSIYMPNCVARHADDNWHYFEADISHLQMPVTIPAGMSVRIMMANPKQSIGAGKLWASPQGWVKCQTDENGNIILVDRDDPRVSEFVGGYSTSPLDIGAEVPETVTLATTGETVTIGQIPIPEYLATFNADGIAQTKGDLSGTLYFDNLTYVYGSTPEDTQPPEISSVLVTAGEGEQEALHTNMTLSSGNLDIEATFADSVQTNANNTGVQSAALYVDGQLIQGDNVLVNIGDGTLKAGLSLANGNHTIRVSVVDGYGNEATREYTVTIQDESISGAPMTVLAQESSAVLGQPIHLQFTPRDNEVDSLEVELNVDEMFAENAQLAVAEGCTIIEEPSYNPISGILRFQVEGNVAGGTMATLTLQVPTSVGAETSFSCRINGHAGGETFNSSVSMPLVAPYTVTGGQMVAELPDTCYFVIKDSGTGLPVEGVGLYEGDNLIGTSDEQGKVAVNEEILENKESITVTAKDSQGNVSVAYTTVIYHSDGDEEGVPTQIWRNAADAADSLNVSWFANPMYAQDAARVQISESREEIEAGSVYDATCDLVTFTDGSAAYICGATITDLKENTTYYYRVGNGESWSEIRSMTTGRTDAGVSALILGDLQERNNTALTGILESLGDISEYDLAIQTGDLVDDGSSYSNWVSALNMLQPLDTNRIFALGNHELEGGIDPNRTIYHQENGNYYSIKVGNVFIATIAYNSFSQEVLQSLIRDAEASEAQWRILVTHQPPYYTNVGAGMGSGTQQELVQAVQQADIDVVLSGHDHSYARTAPMIDGQINEEGITYFICGSLGEKSYDVTETEEFNFEIATNDYSALYMTLATTDNTLTIRAYDYNGGDVKEIDSFTKTEGDTSHQHSYVWDGDSQLTCSECGYAISAAAYTGYAAYTPEGGEQGRVYLNAGNLMTGVFAVGADTVHHAGEDGILHESETVNSAQCWEDGSLGCWCKECNVFYQLSETRRQGHQYDENHVCTREVFDIDTFTYSVCGHQGKDIADLDIKLAFLYAGYTGEKRQPAVTVTDTLPDGTKYELKPQSTYGDFTPYWENNEQVGTATVRIVGYSDGPYYGEATRTFEIVPQNVVEKDFAYETTSNSAHITWEAAPGATKYIFYQKIDGEWTRLGIVDRPEYTVTGLEQGEYQFMVRPFATVDGKDYYSTKNSDVLTVTMGQESGTGISFRESNIEKTYGDPVFVNEAMLGGVTGGAFTYTSSDENVATVDANGQVTIQNAGSAVITAAQGETSGQYSLTVKPKQLALSWTGTETRTYDGQASNVSAEITGQLEEDTVTVTVAGGTQKNAGTHMAEAVIDNANYTLPETNTVEYKITPATISAITWSNTELTYTGKPLAPVASVAEGGGLIQGDSISFTVPMATEVGTYVVSAASLNPNYILADDVKGNSCRFVISLPEIEIEGLDQTDDISWHLSGSAIVISGFAGTVGDDQKEIEVSVKGIINGVESSAYTTVKIPAQEDTENAGIRLGGNVNFQVDVSNVVARPIDITLETGEVESGVSDEIELTEEERQTLNQTAQSADNQFGNILSAIAKHVEQIVTSVIEELDQQAEKVTMKVSQNLQVVDYKPGETYKVNITPVYSLYSPSETGEETPLVTGAAITNDQIAVPVEVSLKVPEDITLNDTTFIRHERSDGRTEYIRPDIILDGNILKFMTDSFSEFEVVTDTREVEVTFMAGEEGATQTRVYDASNVGEALPSLTLGENQRFDGWQFGGKTYTTLTDELLTALVEGKEEGSDTVDVEASIIDTTPPEEPDDSDSHGGGGGGSAGAAENAVTVEQSAHGTISVDPGKAAKGDTVTITVKPDEGYHLDKLTVTDQKGKTVSVTRSADGKYTFKMPETAVTIEADFGEGAASDDLPYTDVGRADWFHDPVAYAYEHGIMSGVSEDRFEPEGTLTRAMMVAMLWRLEGQPQPESVRSFADVPDGTWYTQAVEWAAEKGIVSGYGDDLFGPEDNITREQLAAILYRYAAEKAYDTSQGGMAAREFSDWGSVSPYAEQAISWAVNAGIISGMGDNTLQPQGNATRAQAATLFMQFMENIAKS